MVTVEGVLRWGAELRDDLTGLETTMDRAEVPWYRIIVLRSPPVADRRHILPAGDEYALHCLRVIRFPDDPAFLRPLGEERREENLSSADHPDQ
jgi:hypothetical protein